MPRPRKDGKPASRRASAAEKMYRYNRLFNLIRNGGTAQDCIRFATSQWGISEETAKKYLPHVKGMIMKDFDIDRAQFVAELMQQAASIQMEARRTNQLNIALGAVNTLARLGQVDK